MFVKRFLTVAREVRIIFCIFEEMFERKIMFSNHEKLSESVPGLRLRAHNR